MEFGMGSVIPTEAGIEVGEGSGGGHLPGSSLWQRFVAGVVGLAVYWVVVFVLFMGFISVGSSIGVPALLVAVLVFVIMAVGAASGGSVRTSVLSAFGVNDESHKLPVIADWLLWGVLMVALASPAVLAGLVFSG